jgi:hypothetical protein
VSDGFLAPPLAWELEVPLGAVRDLGSLVAPPPDRVRVLAVRRPGGLAAVVVAAEPGGRVVARTGGWVVLTRGCSAGE